MKQFILTLAMVWVFVGCRQKDEVNTTAAIPQFQVTHADILSVTLETNATDTAMPNGNHGVTMNLEFSKRKADLFHDFTQDHLNQKVQILIDSNVVAEPVLRAVLKGDQLPIRFPSSEAANIARGILRK